jgi:DNA replication protein DnaC
LELEKKKAEYWQQITAPIQVRTYTAEQLRNLLLTSRNAQNNRFIIDKYNEAQVNTLCLYFAGDPTLEEYGYSLHKGLLLMGGLGVGKTHLMSFFFQNQSASYVMTSCRAIENKWVNQGKEDVDLIEYYSNPIQASSNSNPFGHQQLGICLDDMGVETIPSKRYGEEKNVIAEIILARYERRLDFKLTHVTTNLTGEDIKNLYGDRIHDRLKEMFNVISFNNAKSRRV